MILKVKITREKIATSTYVQLDEMVYNKAADLYLGTFGETFKDLPNDLLLKQLFAVTVLDNEVRNGGFYSFFGNTSDLYEQAIEGLQLLNADEHVNLLKQASLIDRTREIVNEDEESELDLLAEKYYDLDNIADKRIKFVRENIERFLG